MEQIINPILSICIENIDYLRAAGSIPALIDSFADTKNIVTLHQNEALKKLKDNLRKLILEEVENLVKNKVPSKTNTLGIIQVIINYKLLEEAPADFSKKYNDLITNTMRKGFEENLIFIKTILQKIQRQELPVLTPKQEKVFIDKLCESMNNAYIFEYSAGKHNIHIELTLGEIFSIWQSRWDIILEQIKKDKSVGELYILAVGVITTLVNKNSPLEAKQFLNFILNAANEITFKDKNSTDFMKLLQLIFSNKFSILYTKDFTLNLKISKLLTTVLKKSKGEKGPLYQFISLIETTLNNQNFKLNKEQEQLIKDVIFHAMEQYYEWPSHIDQTVLITFGNIFDLLKTQWPEMQKQIQERKSPQLLVILGEILKLIQVKKNPEAIQFLNCIFNTLDIITIDENNLDIFLDLITVLISDEYITFYTQNTEFVQSLKKHLTIILNKADKKFSQKLVVLLKSIIQNKLYTIFDISDNILKIIENIKFDMDLLPIFLDEKNLPHIKNNIFSKTESLTKLKEALQKQILLYYNTIKDRKEKTPDDQTKKSIKQLVSEFVLQEKAPNDFITAYQKIVE